MPCAAMAARTAVQRRSSSAVEIGLISRSAKSDIWVLPTGPLTGLHTVPLRGTRTDACLAPKCAPARVCDISLQPAGARRNRLSVQAISIAHSTGRIYPSEARNLPLAAAVPRGQTGRGGPAMALANVSLDDKYDLSKSRI